MKPFIALDVQVKHGVFTVREARIAPSYKSISSTREPIQNEICYDGIS
jgi:hypothetical protein